MSSSLLEKYNLTLAHLSFDYIGNCSNKTSLERIIKVLRSGEEGLYPDLLKRAEIQLQKIDPNNKLLEEDVHLYKRADIAQNDWNDLLSDLKSWEKDIKTQEGIVKALSTQSLDSMPKVRSDLNTLANGSNLKDGETTKKKPDQPEVKIKIKSFDEWNRFDADEELAKIDVKEGLEEEELQRKRNDYSKSEAEYERAKGNQYFKTENYPFALEHYNKSIKLNPTCTVYNNRAMTHIKLKMYAAAVEDCSKVLSLEPDNIKALYRRSSAYIALSDDNSLRNAWRDLKLLLTLDPTNKAAQKEYNSITSRINPPPNPQQAREQLPVIYYGPSTSQFKVMPHSNMHYMWARSHLPTNYVPCRCNCAIPQENPLCRRCGEENIRRLRLKAKNKSKSGPRSLNASEIARICDMRNTNFYVSPPQQTAPVTTSATAKPSSSKIDPHIDAPSVRPSVNLEVDVNSNGMSSKKSEDLTGNEKCRELANKAIQRGDASYSANDFNTALQYYNTSIKFYPQNDSLLKRAKTLIQVKRYPEAVYDCSRVLEIDPNNVQARIRRATAYSHMPEEASLMMGIEDLQNIKSVRGKKDLNDELNELLEVISRRKENFVESSATQPDEEGTVELDPSENLYPQTECVEDYKLDALLTSKKNKKKKNKLNKDDAHAIENNAGDDLANGDDSADASRSTKKTKKKKKKNILANDEASNQLLESETGIHSASRLEDTSASCQNGEMPSDVNTSDVSVPFDEYKALIRKQNKRNKKKLKKVAITETKVEYNLKSVTEAVKSLQLSSIVSGRSSNENMPAAAQSNSMNHHNSSSTSDYYNSEFANNLNNMKSVSHSKLEKYFANMMSNTIDNDELKLKRFWTMWNEFQKCDIQYMYRCKTLLTLTPDLFRAAFKKKLECQTLTELVSTIEFLAKTNPSSAASYLSELPKIAKFSHAKDKITPPAIQKINSLIEFLEKRKVNLQTDTKEAFL